MGVTGSGKSSFVSHYANQVKIGHRLESCTSNIEIYNCTLGDGTPVFLIDTPGFDDTYKTDVDVLRELANWLAMTYEQKILLSGIVYLHRIGDTRIGGSAMRNLRMFRSLVGREGLANVVLATTMWSNNSGTDSELKVLEQREVELSSKAEFWKSMIDQGSRVFRQDRGRQSAEEILQYLVGKKRTVALKIQRELVDKGMTVDKTTAGKEVEAEVAKQREIYEKRLKEIRDDMKLALKQKDEEQQDELKAYREEVELKIKENEKKIQKLGTEKNELRKQLQQEWQREKDKMMGEWKREQARMEQRRIAEENQRARELEHLHEQRSRDNGRRQEEAYMQMVQQSQYQQAQAQAEAQAQAQAQYQQYYQQQMQQRQTYLMHAACSWFDPYIGWRYCNGCGYYGHLAYHP